MFPDTVELVAAPTMVELSVSMINDVVEIVVPGPQGPPGAASTVPGPPGATGPIGPQGPAGPGVPMGGTTGQVLSKSSNADYATAWVNPSAGVTWPLLAPDGTVAAPSYAFSGGPSVGIYGRAGSVIGFAGGASTLAEFYAGGGANLTFKSTLVLGWSTGDPQMYGPDTILVRDAANTLAQRNGTNPQTLRIYGNYVDASNYSRLAIQYASPYYQIASEIAGTGPAPYGLILDSPVLYFQTGETTRWSIAAAGNFLAFTDNTYDIGASGANRPRNGYFAGAGVFGGNLFVTGFGTFGGSVQIANASTLFSAIGAPAAGTGNNGDFYFRTDTPGTANQRIYVKSAGAWVGIV